MSSTTSTSRMEREQIFTCGAAVIVANRPIQETALDRFVAKIKAAWDAWTGIEASEATVVSDTIPEASLPEAA